MRQNLQVWNGEKYVTPNAKLMAGLMRMWNDNHDHAYISSTLATVINLMLAGY
jgi:hypothetical protein